MSRGMKKVEDKVVEDAIRNGRIDSIGACFRAERH